MEWEQFKIREKEGMKVANFIDKATVEFASKTGIHLHKIFNFLIDDYIRLYLTILMIAHS